MTDAKNPMQVHLIPAFNDNYLFAVPFKDSRSCFVVDPGDAKAIIEFLDKEKLTLAAILITHHHADHIGGVKPLVAATGCQRVVGPRYDTERISGITEAVKEGDRIEVGAFVAEILFTPGHTDGHICYYFATEKTLFCGDTLFSAGCGRMFEGTKEQMWNSMLKLLELPDDTRVYCAHEYTLKNIEFALSVDAGNAELVSYKERCEALRENDVPTIPSTIGQEKKVNPFLRAGNASTFGNLRRAKDVF